MLPAVSLMSKATRIKATGGVNLPYIDISWPSGPIVIDSSYGWYPEMEKKSIR